MPPGGGAAFVYIFLIIDTWLRASGRVVGNHSQRRNSAASDSYAFFSLIELQAIDGKCHEEKDYSRLTDKWLRGKTVTRKYRAADPRKATIIKGWQRPLFAGVFLGFAAAGWHAWFGVLR